MTGVGICGSRDVANLPPCRCGKAVTIKYAERHGEGDQPDGTLGDSARFEAWIDCPSCGWQSDLQNIENWSDEVFYDEPLTEKHISQAVDGCANAWREQRKGGA